MMNAYLEIEQRLDAAKERFSSAFDAVKNARIVKTQRNNFALRCKFPLLMLLCVVGIVAVLVFQLMFRQFDALYIVCECIIIVALTAFFVLLAISWSINLKNAKCAEVIEYYNGKTKCLMSEITGGGRKVEWSEARFFFSKKDEAELFEGGAKTYSPFSYKKIRGHSRNFVLLSSEAIVSNFFVGAEVIGEEDGIVALSSGFRFCEKDGALAWFEIQGMYSECYENNFPIYAPLSASPSYLFRYEFNSINRKNYKMILPEITRDACKYYFLRLPSDADENVLIQDLKK